MSKTQTEVHPVDKHVGEKVRLRRLALGLTQSDLAKTLGLTFQQVQKYEKGTNRVSASKLFETARGLHVPIAFFFEGLPETGAGGGDETAIIHQIMGDKEDLEFLRRYAALTDDQKSALRTVAQGYTK